MATYGDTPGVKITTSTGNLSTVEIGRGIRLMFVGIGNDSAQADPNEPTNITSVREAEEEFGEDTDIVRAFERARDEGANTEYTYGVRANVSSESEVFSSESGTINDAPIVPDMDTIDTDLDVEQKFRYESPVDPPEGDNVIHINPLTGEYDLTYDGTFDDVEIEYDWADWSTAIDNVGNDLYEGDFALVVPLTNSEDVAEMARAEVEDLRDSLVFALTASAAEPNASMEDSYPEINTSEYTHDFDDDALFLFGPTALGGAKPDSADFGVGAIGSVAGKITGTAVGDPVYDDIIDVGEDGLGQSISRSEVGDLRDQDISPIKDSRTVRIEGNTSTYDPDDEEWERDLFRRQVVDLVMASVYQIARSKIGNVLVDGTLENVGDAIDSQFREFEDQRLLQPGNQQFEVFQEDDRTIGINATITPFGVAKSAEFDLQINL